MLQSKVGESPLIPECVAVEFGRRFSPRSPEVLLWREVVARAVFDAVGAVGATGIRLTPKTTASHDRRVRAARLWIKLSPDFEVCCSMAGLDPAPIRRGIASTSIVYEEDRDGGD